MRHALAVALALPIVFGAHVALARPASVAEMDAVARGAGNRKDVAVAIGRKLFATVWPAQITKIRVDGIGRHTVAGVIVSGVKFHRALTPRAFEDESLAIAAAAFEASPVEEVDVWATVPLAVAKGLAVSGDFAQPTSRTVFGVSLLRSERAPADRVHRGVGIYWAPDFKARLEGGR